MLTEMDGAQGLEGVYVLAATSRPDLIDPALLRPGRLDKAVLCDMPSKMDRQEIIESLARKLHLAPSVDLEQLSEDTEGFSGADLQALVYNAHLDVVHAVLNRPEEEKEPKDKGKGKAVDKGNGKAVENGDAVHDAGSVVAGPVYRQLQPEEAPTTSANRAAFSERVSTLLSCVQVIVANDRSKPSSRARPRTARRPRTRSRPRRCRRQSSRRGTCASRCATRAHPLPPLSVRASPECKFPRRRS